MNLAEFYAIMQTNKVHYADTSMGQLFFSEPEVISVPKFPTMQCILENPGSMYRAGGCILNIYKTNNSTTSVNMVNVFVKHCTYYRNM